MHNRTKWMYLGCIAWMLSLQYYIVQLITANHWSPAYSLTKNTISDLANTHCGMYGQRLICSPLHNYMNLSFLILGVTMICGSYFLSQTLAKNRLSKLGFSCMAIAGIGTILVGLFPENTIGALHITGAGLAFFFGNIGMVLIGIGVKSLGNFMRSFSVSCGLLGLIALVLFLGHAYLGLGIGGMERLAGYPQSIWMISVALYLLLHVRTKRRVE